MVGPPTERDLDHSVLVSLERLVPPDHFYRHLDVALASPSPLSKPFHQSGPFERKGNCQDWAESVPRSARAFTRKPARSNVAREAAFHGAQSARGIFPMVYVSRFNSSIK